MFYIVEVILRYRILNQMEGEEKKEVICWGVFFSCANQLVFLGEFLYKINQRINRNGSSVEFCLFSYVFIWNICKTLHRFFCQVSLPKPVC